MPALLTPTLDPASEESAAATQPSHNLRILLLQARYPDDPAKAEEVRSFAARCGVEPEQLISHDLLAGPPTLAALRRHDALMVGGSGEFYVSKRDLPRHQELLDFLAEVIEIGHPTFASCYGFQCLTQVLGGEVIYDPDNTEVGTFQLTLTEAGRRDPLFGHLPPVFQAQLGHKDRAADHLAEYPTLASSVTVPVEALRIPGKPIWATQFHSELDRATNIGRFKSYLEGYASVMTPEELTQALEERFRESPATLDLLERFLRLVFA